MLTYYIDDKCLVNRKPCPRFESQDKQIMGIIKHINNLMGM